MKSFQELKLFETQEAFCEKQSKELLSIFSFFTTNVQHKQSLCRPCFVRQIVDLMFNEELKERYDKVQHPNLSGLYMEFLSLMFLLKLLQYEPIKKLIEVRCTELTKIYPDPNNSSKNYLWFHEQILSLIVLLTEKFLDNLLLKMYNHSIPTEKLFFVLEIFLNVWFLTTKSYTFSLDENQKTLFVCVHGLEKQIEIAKTFKVM